MHEARTAGTIGVERIERTASAGAADDLIGALDERPGIWLGSDVEIEGLYRRHAVALVDPCIAFSIDGRTLAARALDATGAALLGAAGRWDGDPIETLRRFLSMFRDASAELALYGAFSWDYFRIAQGRLPDDGRRRMLLYFPSRVLVAEGASVREVEFRFSIPQGSAPDTGTTPAPRPPREDAVDDAPGAHAARVRDAIRLLRSGRLYSLVMSRTFRRQVKCAPSVAFRLLRERNPYPAMFFANFGDGEHLFGASPDMQVRADREFVESAPVCGTYRRGADAIEDADQARALLDSDKESASLAACADADANDKAAVCVPGSVELVSHRRLHLYPTVVHTIAHLRGRRRPGIDAFDVLFAHAAPATVTGSPKEEAIAAIERLESGWRNWYGGAIARLGSDGSCEVLTVLRAARVSDGIAEIRTGGSLLADSKPEFEEEETQLKAQTLFRALSGEWPAQVTSRPAGGAFRLVADGDPFAGRLADFIAYCGCSMDKSGTPLVSGSEPGPRQHGIWIGDASISLLEAEGARAIAFDVPMHARLAESEARADTSLAGLGILRIGLYSARGIREDGMPPGWRVVLCSSAGWVLAAEHPETGRFAILGRPDSILSRALGSGRKLLVGARDFVAST